MRELIRRRLHGDQSGVTMIIVALCMVALIGMIVLVVDVEDSFGTAARW